MGSGASTLDNGKHPPWSREELKLQIQSLGGTDYEHYAQKIFDAGIDGKTVLQLEEQDLDELETNSRMHRIVLSNKLAELKACRAQTTSDESRPQLAVQPGGSTAVSSPRRQLQQAHAPLTRSDGHDNDEDYEDEDFEEEKVSVSVEHLSKLREALAVAVRDKDAGASAEHLAELVKAWNVAVKDLSDRMSSLKEAVARGDVVGDVAGGASAAEKIAQLAYGMITELKKLLRFLNESLKTAKGTLKKEHLRQAWQRAISKLKLHVFNLTKSQGALLSERVDSQLDKAEDAVTVAGVIASSGKKILKVMAMIPIVGPAFQVACEIMEEVENLQGKAKDVIEAGRRVADVIEYLEKLPRVLAYLGEEQQEELYKKMETLEELLKEFRVCVLEFGKKGWLKRFVTGSKAVLTLVKLDKEIQRLLEKLDSTYRLAVDEKNMHQQQEVLRALDQLHERASSQRFYPVHQACADCDETTAKDPQILQEVAGKAGISKVVYAEEVQEFKNMMGGRFDEVTTLLEDYKEVLAEGFDNLGRRMSEIGNIVGRTVKQEDGYYLVFAVQPPPLGINMTKSSLHTMPLLSSLSHKIEAEELNYLRNNQFPICVADCHEDSSSLLGALCADEKKPIHCLVWCAVGVGWEIHEQHSDMSLNPPSAFESVLAAVKQNPPQVMCVLTKYGAQEAAERLFREAGVVIVIWISVNVLDQSLAADFYEQVLQPAISTPTEDNISSKVSSFFQSRSSKTTVPCGVSIKDDSTFTIWQPLENLKSKWLERAFANTPTNIFDTAGIRPLLACDEGQVKDVKDWAAANNTCKFVWRDRDDCEDRGLERGRSIVAEASQSFLCRNSLFSGVYRVSTDEDAKKLMGEKLIADKQTARKVLVWFDVTLQMIKGVSEAGEAGAIKSLADTVNAARRFKPQMTLLITAQHGCYGIASGVYDAIANFEKIDEQTIDVHDGGGILAESAILCNSHHNEFIMLTGISSALLELYGVRALCRTVENVLPKDGAVLALYPDGSSDHNLYIRVTIRDVGFLHQFRDMVLSHDFVRGIKKEIIRVADESQPGIQEEIKQLLTTATIEADLSCFAEAYENGVLCLNKLTPHQAEKLKECCPEGQLIPSKDTHLMAPAGGGKTFVVQHLVDKLFRNDKAAVVLYAVCNVALALFFGKWICTRFGSEREKRKVLERLHVLTTRPDDPNSRTLVLQKFIYDNGCLSLKEVEVKVAYSLMIVDEAHHLYQDAAARAAVEMHHSQETRLMLLSDVSQSTGFVIKYPVGLVSVVLTEVVRSSKRIVAGAMNFQSGDKKSDKLLTRCHHESTGPPLKTFLFDAAADSDDLFSKYATEVITVLGFILKEYHGLDLHDRVAIIVPDKTFLVSFKAALTTELDLHMQTNANWPPLALVNSAEAAWTVTRSHSMKEQWLVVDTVDAFDGLERLMVIAVGLDSVIGNGKTAQTRSHLYRGITRAHMLVVVVNELLQGGWLEWLTRLTLTDEKEFDAKEELITHKGDATKEALALESDKEKAQHNKGPQPAPTETAAAAAKQQAPVSLLSTVTATAKDGGSGSESTVQGVVAKEKLKQSVWDTSTNTSRDNGTELRFMPRVHGSADTGTGTWAGSLCACA